MTYEVTVLSRGHKLLSALFSFFSVAPAAIFLREKAAPTWLRSVAREPVCIDRITRPASGHPEVSICGDFCLINWVLVPICTKDRLVFRAAPPTFGSPELTRRGSCARDRQAAAATRPTMPTPYFKVMLQCSTHVVSIEILTDCNRPSSAAIKVSLAAQRCLLHCASRFDRYSLQC